MKLILFFNFCLAAINLAGGQNVWRKSISKRQFLTYVAYYNKFHCEGNPDKRFFNPLRCDVFKMCIKGKPVQIECPNKMMYKVSTQRCEPVDRVDCSFRDIPFEKQKIGFWNENTICPRPRRANITDKFPIMNRCETFIECASGMPHVRGCPPGSEFRTDFRICDAKGYTTRPDCHNSEYIDYKKLIKKGLEEWMSKNPHLGIGNGHDFYRPA